jgi:hypothetical protein
LQGCVNRWGEVLDSSGSGPGVIAGIQWVVNQHASMYGVAVDGSTAGAA